MTVYPAYVVASRVSRRTAIVAAAGWVAAPPRVDGDGWPCSDAGAPAVGAETSATVGGAEHVFLLYRDLARFLQDTDTGRRAALRSALGRRHAAAEAAYGDGFHTYLLDQMDGLCPHDAAWAAAADAADVPGQVRNGLARARALLRAGESPAVFVIFSRRFDGRTDGRSIFLGVNRFGTERLRDQVALLTAHEYNHIVRARAASFGTVLDAVVAEGLATACSELAEPGRPLEDYLLFTRAQRDWFTAERLARLWRELGADARAAGPARQRYLDGGHAGPCDAPPRSGYYLGYMIVRAWLARGISIAALTRMPAEVIWRGSGYAE